MTTEAFCIFEKSKEKEGVVQCVRGGCGNYAYAEDPTKVMARCRGGRPGVVQRASNFAAAVARDLTAGRPRRTEEEIASIRIICQANFCGLYNAEHNWCEHRQCGCDVDKKAAWEKEVCPMGLWS